MISCYAKGELVYINSLRDFEDVVDPSVYEALKQFVGEDIGDRTPAAVMAHMECRIEDLKEEVDSLEDDNRDLENENDDLTEENEKLTEENEQITKKYDGLLDTMEKIKNMIEEEVWNDTERI